MMTVLAAELTFSIAHARSLKDKRMVVRSLVDKVRHKFNTAIAEVAAMDEHQTLIIGIAVVSGDASHAREMLEEIIRFLQAHADAELLCVEEY